MDNVRKRVIEFKNGFYDESYIELVKMITRLNNNINPFKVCEIINRYRIGSITEEDVFNQIEA